MRFYGNQLLIQVSNCLYRSSSLQLYFEYFDLGSSLVEVVYCSVMVSILHFCLNYAHFIFIGKTYCSCFPQLESWRDA